MNHGSTLERKRSAFRRYFGENPRSEDMFGTNPFTHTYEELEALAREYREWHTSTDNHEIENVPNRLMLPFQVHYNMSSENLSRARLLSVLTDIGLDEATEQVMSARSLPVSLENFNGAMIYASTIYRGKTQVNTGTAFERRIADFVNNIGEDIEMVSGRSHNGNKYDKDILIDGEYRLSAEISFQVTTNSVIERKSHLNIPADMTVIMIFGGLGWIERINALERIAGEESGYADCFGPSEEEMNRLREYIESFRESE